MTELVLPHSIDAGTEIVAAEHQENYEAIRDVINGQLEGGSGASGNIAANGVTAREIADAVLKYGGQNEALQEGVIGSGDGKVTPGAGLVLSYAAGVARVTDDSGVIGSGVLVPVTFSGATVTVEANATGNPRIDQVILTMTGWNTGTVSVLQGTAAVGATLDNRTGAASLGNDAIRLADILMPNGFAGPFVQTTHIRDRRPWARGAYRTITHADATDLTLSSTSFGQIFTWTPPRLEISSGLVEVSIDVSFADSTTTGSLVLAPASDAAADTTLGRYSIAVSTGDAGTFSNTWRLTPAAGSHTFDVYGRMAGGNAVILRTTANQSLPQLTIREIIRQNAENSGA